METNQIKIKINTKSYNKKRSERIENHLYRGGIVRLNNGDSARLIGTSNRWGKNYYELEVLGKRSIVILQEDLTFSTDPHSIKDIRVLP